MKDKLYFCIWYKCEYGKTSSNTDALVLRTASAATAKDFCKELLADGGDNWTEYNIYCAPYNDKNKFMKNIYNTLERIPWEDYRIGV